MKIGDSRPLIDCATRSSFRNWFLRNGVGLAGTRITTNIRTGDEEQRDPLNLVDASSMRRKHGLDSRLPWVEIKLSEWVFNSIRSQEVLTLNREYFRLGKPLRRYRDAGRLRHHNSATLYPMKVRGATAHGVAVIDDKTPESELDGMQQAPGMAN